MSALLFGRCQNCFDAEGQPKNQDGALANQEAFALGPNEIRAMPAEHLLKVDTFVDLGLWLHGLKIDVPIGLRNDKKPFALPLVRWMLAYALYGGLERGIKYTWPCGCPLAIEPETIDEVFDGRKTEHLPVTDDWSSDPVSYDRSIRFWVGRAVAGEITQDPGPRWLGRLTLLQLARDTMNSELFKDN